MQFKSYTLYMSESPSVIWFVTEGYDPIFLRVYQQLPFHTVFWFPNCHSKRRHYSPFRNSSTWPVSIYFPLYHWLFQLSSLLTCSIICRVFPNNSWKSFLDTRRFHYEDVGSFLRSRYPQRSPPTPYLQNIDVRFLFTVNDSNVFHFSSQFR